MAHNFKLTGDYYVSVDGSDSNNGLTKDTPKRTIQAGLNLITTNSKTLVVGAGVYNETISRGVSIIGVLIIADGIVILDGVSGKTFFLNSMSGTFSGFILRNYSIGPLTTGTSFTYSNCTIINCSIVQQTITWTGCLFINTTCDASSASPFGMYSMIFINSSVKGNLAILLNSYGNSNSLWNMGAGTTAANFNYNNIQGTIIMSIATSVTTGTYQDTYGRYYDLSIATSTGDGTIGNPYGRPYTLGAGFNFATHRILYPTFNVNSFSSDPKFNNIEAQDFTLQVTSPHLGRASDGTNIGGTKYAVRYAAKGAEFNTSAVSITGLAFVGNDWTVSGGTTGEVISAPMLISSTTKVLQKISYNGLLEFNKLITPPATGNRNVPDQEVYDSTTQPPNIAGANPDRLVYYLRYSTQTAQPTTNSEWDNGGFWTAGNYGTFEWNTKPSIDNAFVGNGDPAFNAAATPTFLNVTWIQLKVKLRNDYA
jgi:hypothetical protein